MAHTTKTLTHKQMRTIVALVTEPSIPKAAEVAKVGQRTIYDWMKQPEFKVSLREARRESIAQAVSLAQRNAPLAMMMWTGYSRGPQRHPQLLACIELLRFVQKAMQFDVWRRWDRHRYRHGPTPQRAEQE